MIAVTAIQAGSLKVGDFIGIAVRAAHYSIQPANANHKLAAVLRIAEVLDARLQCFRCFHSRTLSNWLQSVKYIIASIFALLAITYIHFSIPPLLTALHCARSRWS